MALVYRARCNGLEGHFTPRHAVRLDERGFYSRMHCIHVEGIDND